MPNLLFFSNQNYSVFNAQCNKTIVGASNRLGIALFVLFVFYVANLFAVSNVYASEHHGREHKNIQYKKYERNTVHSGHRSDDGERKYKKDKHNPSRYQSESNHQGHSGHKRDDNRSQGQHHSENKHRLIKSPSAHRPSHQYYPYYEKKHNVKKRYPKRYVSKRHSHYSAHEYKPHQRHYDKHYYSSRQHHKNEVAFLMGGIILGAVLANNDHYSKTHYSDGFKIQSYTRLRKSGCYEVAYEGGQRVLVEVPKDYCRAN